MENDFFLLLHFPFENFNCIALIRSRLIPQVPVVVYNFLFRLEAKQKLQSRVKLTDTKLAKSHFCDRKKWKLKFGQNFFKKSYFGYL